MDTKIRAIIIDDEARARDILKLMLDEFCPEVELIDEANSVATGIESVETHKPDLLFLDIDMVDGYGFEVLNETIHYGYGVIFTTAYSSFGAKAFEYSALHYLLKPIDVDALKESIVRYRSNRIVTNQSQLDTLNHGLSNRPNKIHIQVNDEIEVFELSEISYLSSIEGITFLHLFNGQTRTVGQSLNHFESLLEGNGFYRAHAKYLVNLRAVKRIKSLGRNGTVVLKNDITVTLSARKKHGFTEALKEWML